MPPTGKNLAQPIPIEPKDRRLSGEKYIGVVLREFFLPPSKTGASRSRQAHGVKGLRALVELRQASAFANRKGVLVERRSGRETPGSISLGWHMSATMVCVLGKDVHLILAKQLEPFAGSHMFC